MCSDAHEIRALYGPARHLCGPALGFKGPAHVLPVREKQRKGAPCSPDLFGVFGEYQETSTSFTRVGT